MFKYLAHAPSFLLLILSLDKSIPNTNFNLLNKYFCISPPLPTA